ncbi:MAG TPA: dephospho-CoA kinase [Candidatus Angelobacter sp.]|nr:dephospho-CoA kinase [Candidatus Angelobacter sp.]
MLKVGLTGGFACGKSTVAKMCEDLGARVVYADKIAHELYRPGQPVYEELVKRFGAEIVQPDGEIDRAKLASIVFNNGRVEELNKIVHPAVIRRQEQLMHEISAREPNAVIMVEAALIFEAGAKNRFSKMVVVTCRPDQKVARYAQRAGIGEAVATEEVQRRSKAQLPDDEKMRRADYVIDNSGSLERTRQQVERVYAELKTLAIGRPSL